MGAQAFVSRLYNQLENLLREESTGSDPRFQEQVQEASRYLPSLEEFPEDDVGSASGVLLQLQAVYLVEDVTDTLLVLKQFLEIKRRDNNVFKKFLWRRSSSSRQIQLTGDMKKLAKALYNHLHLIHKKEAAETTILKIDDFIGGITHHVDFWEHHMARPWQRISSYCFEQEINLVGLEEQINNLVSLLIREHNHNSQVIAIVGEAGSGKTTLTRSVYDRVDVKRHFAKRAWVRVRSEAKVRDVLIDILQQINDEMLVEASSPEEELASSLATLVKETSYLIVVEDVETPQVWQVLRKALDYSSSKSKDGKIILTTSNENNIPPEAKAAGSTLHVRRLNEEESWELLLRTLTRAAELDGVLNNSELVTLKERILKICGGLPMRIVLLGGLLSATVANYKEWPSVIDRAAVDKSDGGVSGLLALSYQKLPSGLKPFFLYMGVFPRAFEVPVRRLIHLWCTEPFVLPIDTDLAETYFEELVIRNLIHVTKWRLDGTPKMCRLPTVLYDVFSPEAAKAGFFHHQLESSSAEEQQPQFAVRRLATYLGVSTNFIPSEWSWSWHLRSYVAFDTRIQGSPATEIYVFLDKMITAKSNRGEFVLLTVLELEGVYKPKLSDDVLRSTFIDSLPKSVGILPRLETLDVKHTKLRFLPDSIWKAKKLQHLYLNWIHSPIDGLSLSSLNNLQTLWGLSIESYTPPRQPDPKEFPGLRTLGVKCNSPMAINFIKNLVSESHKLQAFKLVCARSDEFVGIEYGEARVTTLQELYLRGTIHSLFDYASVWNYPNLKILTLSMSRLVHDPMPPLEKLAQLKILRLYRGAYLGGEMTCKSGGFPQLRVLKLWNLFSLEEWTVKKGAMPRLRELEIRSCNNLKPPQPQGLQNLTNTLKEFVLTNMPSTFGDAVEPILQGTNVHIQKNQWSSFL
ncbi:hypothetical protein CICLE_v10030333mg [Citrus x clementina]|uniref:Uncharacterized protein n=1 Tax=Citrus clementina TaxID=85681 RepID=V4UEQ7_CITCL|nr:probable disease resistance protein RF9 [Citrus x clementina]ESR37804.1 hypothetical protein CICLE_v10030333mg [Citrus x clementina]